MSVGFAMIFGKELLFFVSKVWEVQLFAKFKTTQTPKYNMPRINLGQLSDYINQELKFAYIKWQ
jgi:hypothetical protein